MNALMGVIFAAAMYVALEGWIEQVIDRVRRR